MTISNFLEDKLLDLVFNAVAYGGQATVYVKLHTGDPGEAGTANAAANATRKAATFGASAAGVVTNDSAATWTNVPNAETYSHVSLWDAETGGNCLWVGALTAAKTVAVGDTFNIAIGALTVSLD
jgi:hypothetical protein